MKTPKTSARSATRSTTSSHTPLPSSTSLEGDRTPLAALLDRLSPPLRREVLTHRSWASGGEPSNERLELLGDSVLQLVVTEALMVRHPKAEEGDLAWMRQEVVSRNVCADVARRGGLPELLRAAAPTERPDLDAVIGSDRVQAGLVEALLGAAWLELEADVVRLAVTEAFENEMVRTRTGMRDAKTALQEMMAKRHQDVHYELVAQHGPAHDRSFETQVLIAGVVTGTGVGASKRASETAAAADALAALGGGS